MKFSLTVLGSNAALPANGRFPTAQILNVQEQLFLIDCGEGTQVRMQENRIRRSKINQIFISHLHGDHIYGLIGLLTSYSLNGRQEALEIFAPKGLEEIIDIQIKYGGGGFPYPLAFHETNPAIPEKIFENSLLTVSSFPLKHRVPTTGFLFKEKERPLKIRVEQIEKYQIPYPKIREIKAGAALTLSNGDVIPNTELTLPAPPPRSFAYCSDTIFDPSIVPYIKGVNLLYHETTFCEDKKAQATPTMHSTARQAASIAKAGEVGQLITGHYSSRYVDLTPFLEEAQAVFQNTELGLEGKTFEVAFKT